MNKVILVDDEIRILRQLEKIIPWNELGYEIAGTFRKGKDVIRFLETNSTDAILTDIKMPDMSGLELAKFCHEHYPLIKIVIISAYDDFKYAQEALRYNISDYIMKPISKEKLSSALIFIGEQININKKTVYSDDYIQKKIILFESAYLKKAEVEELEKASNELNISVSWTKCESAVISFYEDELENFLRNHNHETNKFMFILSKIMSQETKVAYGSVIKDEAGKIKILLVSKMGIRSDKFFGSIEEYITVTEKSITELFGVNLKLDYEKTSLKREDKAVSKTNETLEGVIEYIHKNYSKHLNLKELSQYSCLNPSYLSDIFKKYTKMTITDYINKVRIEEAQKIIENTNTKLSAVAFLVGFASTSYFHRMFKNQTGYSPNEYKLMFLDKKDYKE